MYIICMSQFNWSIEKNKTLIEKRGISFEEIVAAIETGSLIGELRHPSRDNQFIMIIMVDGYPWDVPYVVQEDGSKFLKTAFPNRKRK